MGVDVAMRVNCAAMYRVCVSRWPNGKWQRCWCWCFVWGVFFFIFFFLFHMEHIEIGLCIIDLKRMNRCSGVEANIRAESVCYSSATRTANGCMSITSNIGCHALVHHWAGPMRCSIRRKCMNRTPDARGLTWLQCFGVANLWWCFWPSGSIDCAMQSDNNFDHVCSMPFDWHKCDR